MSILNPSCLLVKRWIPGRPSERRTKTALQIDDLGPLAAVRLRNRKPTKRNHYAPFHLLHARGPANAQVPVRRISPRSDAVISQSRFLAEWNSTRDEPNTAVPMIRPFDSVVMDELACNGSLRSCSVQGVHEGQSCGRSRHAVPPLYNLHHLCLFVSKMSSRLSSILIQVERATSTMIVPSFSKSAGMSMVSLTTNVFVLSC